VQAPKRRGAQARKPLDRRLLAVGGGVIVVIAAVAVWAALEGGGSSANNSPPQIAWSSLPGLQTGPPPWGPNLALLDARLAPLRLNPLTAEGTVLHIHQHLDVWVNGTKVALAPNTGIDDNTFITELHVHPGEPNIIHVESPKKANFYLGQFFGVWGVRLTAKCVGSYCGRLHWWVNGQVKSGNPADLKLADHQAIVIALGKPPTNVPASFNFARFGL
jgi:hypothetical protein